MDERLEVQVSVQLHGAAPGVNNGGVVNVGERELTIICKAMSIPEHLEANVNHLDIGDALLAKDIELPEGSELITDAEAVVVSCDMPTEVAEETDGIGETAEPEVVGSKEGDEEGGD